MKLDIVRGLRWTAPLSLALGALLALIQPGQWWIGWLAFSLILIIGSSGLLCTWRYAGGGRTLGVLVVLAFGLRLLTGIGLTLGLPQLGNDTPQQNTGYVFFDSYRRDAQAWELARSDKPLLAAFDKSFATDQYGGLLALSAGMYRYLSPEAHRPLLIILLGALAAALGMPFLWRAAQRVWGEAIAWPAAWIFALYPESILLGSAQMREPFLLSFTALILWGFVDWQYNHQRSAWKWLGFGLAGILLTSPGIIFILLVAFTGWYWIIREQRTIAWRVVLITGVVFALASALFIWGVTRDFTLGGLKISAIADWFMAASKWDIYLLQGNSGRVEKIFSEMSPNLRVPFVIGYGLLQPVLPAAFIEPTLPIWRYIGVLRAVGWYALLPLLVYGWLSAVKFEDKRERAQWLWLGLVVWLWITISAVRAGGDQWDNPRYRTILLAVAALVAAQGWTRRRDGWFVRILAVEGVLVAFFTEWYLSRYVLNIPKLLFFDMVAWIGVISAIILIGGWLWDFWSSRHA